MVSPFARITDKNFSGGFYVNVIFESAANTIAALHHRFTLSEDVYRVLFTIAPEPKEGAAAAAGTVPVAR